MGVNVLVIIKNLAVKNMQWENGRMTDRSEMYYNLWPFQARGQRFEINQNKNKKVE